MRNTRFLEAAALHAEANKSDPFAARRVMLHMERRLVSARDVSVDAIKILKDRRARIEADFKMWKQQQRRVA